MEGLNSTVADAILDALCRSVAWTEPASFNIKLHSGAPGSAGTANAFGDATRKAVTFSAASGGAITNSADIAWTNLSAGGTISHWSAWSDISAGSFICSDALAASKTVDSGDNFSIVAGELDIDLSPLASA